MITNKNVATKLAAQPTTTNGNSSGNKNEVNASIPKAEIPAIIPLPRKEPVTSSIEDRFFKMDLLFSHREKWEIIKESLDKVNKFKLTTDGRSDSITFKDGASNSFTTFSPEVLSKVITWLKDDLSKKLSDVEAEINL